MTHPIDRTKYNEGCGQNHKKLALIGSSNANSCTVTSENVYTSETIRLTVRPGQIAWIRLTVLPKQQNLPTLTILMVDRSEFAANAQHKARLELYISSLTGIRTIPGCHLAQWVTVESTLPGNLDFVVGVLPIFVFGVRLVSGRCTKKGKNAFEITRIKT